MCTANDGTESCLIRTDDEFSAPPEPLSWAGGEANGDRRALVQSEKCAVLRYGGRTGRCGLTACVARALQRCPSRAGLALLLRPQEVRRVDNTGTQCDPKTLGSLAQYTPYCRLKGKLFEQSSAHQIKGLRVAYLCCIVTTQPGTSGTRGVPKKTLLRAAIALCPCFFIVEM